METETRSAEIEWQSQSTDGQVLLSMPWEIFVLCVAVLSIVNLVLALIVRNPELDQVVVNLPAVESLHDDEARAMGTVVTEILLS